MLRKCCTARRVMLAPEKSSGETLVASGNSKGHFVPRGLKSAGSNPSAQALKSGAVESGTEGSCSISAPRSAPVF